MMREAKRRMEAHMKQTSVRHYLQCFGKVAEFAGGVNPYRQAAMLWGIEQVDRTWISKEGFATAWGLADPEERLVLALAGGMGLRRSEVAGLRLDDVEDGCVVIRGKGSGPYGKVVVRQMPPTVAATIAEYMPYRQSVLDAVGDKSGGNLLVMSRRRRGTPATVGFLDNMVRGLSDRVGERFSCHTLRRFYCLSLMDAGLDLDTVRRMMRHESLDTTLNRYIRADPSRIASATEAVERSVFGGLSVR
jgi:integrase